jgi:hypothetical protein
VESRGDPVQTSELPRSDGYFLPRNNHPRRAVGGEMAEPGIEQVRDEAREVTKELREKIQSKMDVGKFFAGFITLLIGILLNDCGQLAPEAQIGMILLVSSLGFCVAAVFSYDRLLMPRKYWSALTSDERTEESFQDRLQKEMVRSWKWLFVPAVSCFGIGFLLTLAGPLGLKSSLAVKPSILTVFVFVLLAAGVVAPILIGTLKQPRIYK